MYDPQSDDITGDHNSHRMALFGGVYNNYIALDAAITDARRRGADEIYCLGDLGAFGPHPDRVFPLLIDNEIPVVRGNYDDSIGRELPDCQCGYTDPRDNQFAALSYRYTYQHTSPQWRPWLRTLPREIRFKRNGRRFLLCHGSPRRTNEFLWESTTSTHFLNRLADDGHADIILATHSGIKWHRPLSGGRHFVNVGALGRPENDGQPTVWYAILDISPDSAVSVEFIPLTYDHEKLAAEMREEKIAEEFVETILSGWWTTCLEILPAKERARGRY
jgi:diadenosine tetraphosphatase ApaH/serine/threonine PP2A family protein phosphatase